MITSMRNDSYYLEIDKNGSSGIKLVSEGYDCEIDSVCKDEWSDLMLQFDDANIYQTWPYGMIRWGEQSLNHFVFKRNGKVVGLAQVSVKKLPVVGAGVAYIPWGPIWRRRGEEVDYEALRHIVRILREEYVVRRRLLLRVSPNERQDDNDAVHAILEEEGLRWAHPSYRTILLDLTLSMEELRNRLNRSWRAKLISAERKKLTVIEGTQDDLYATLLIPYYEMLARKRFVPGIDVNEFRAVQENLPPQQKMKIMICEFEGEPVGSLLGSLIGNKGIFVLGGNSERGLKLGASHLLPWRMIEWMKKSGARWCDLGGYNPEKNPGTGRFKEGFSGKDMHHIGQFEACENSASTFLAQAADHFKQTSQAVRVGMKGICGRFTEIRGKGRKTKMKNAFDVLEERGFIEQATDKLQVRELLEGATTCYIGFDPTAKSLHVGSLVPIMSLVHMQQAGHQPIVVVGGGTALIGDPSGKTETRPVMMREEIAQNTEAIKRQLSRFIDFGDGKALILDNSKWLNDLNYIEFLRDIGRHFSVNRMLAAESYKSRMETGLSFIEFNYMLLQAYDFWYLFAHYDCRLQMGGNDQWGNILAGADLVRRLEGSTTHGLTFPLMTTASGVKMGKTHQGAVWLDPALTSPYDYYQYWINQDDRDIERFLAFFTLLPMDEVRKLGSLEGGDIRQAKEVLAFEATKICHGQGEAEKARTTSRELFGRERAASSASVPSFILPINELRDGVPAYILFERTGLCKTRSESRRLIGQGGGYVNEVRIDSFDKLVDLGFVRDNAILLRAGKKNFIKIVVK